MLSILNRALSWAITSFGNKFNLKKRSRLIKALDSGFYVKFMQLEIGLFGAAKRHLSSVKSSCHRNRLGNSVLLTIFPAITFRKLPSCFDLAFPACLSSDVMQLATSSPLLIFNSE